MSGMKRVFIKQKQLLEITLGQHMLDKKEGIRSIHPERYYVKLAFLHKITKGAIKILNSLDEDVYKEEVEYEQ